MMNSKKTVDFQKAPSTFYIKIVKGGPYLVYGNPPLNQEIIVPDSDGHAWSYRKGMSFEVEKEPYSLCRCGGSGKKPYCDGSHKTEDWEPEETSDFNLVLSDSEWYEGQELLLSDDEKLCAFARFCDAKGRIWNIVGNAKTESDKEVFFHESGHCPSGRLIGWDKKTGEAFEPNFAPSISLIEDPQIKVSGPIWVKGGIRVESADGKSYEIRNRVTLCRCGQSSNKPFCNGTHASMHFKDGLPIVEKQEIQQ